MKIISFFLIETHLLSQHILSAPAKNEHTDTHGCLYQAKMCIRCDSEKTRGVRNQYIKSALVINR